MTKEKEKKQDLTQALIKQLRDDGYCFDPEHMKDIETLRVEADRLKEELKSKNLVDAAEYEKKISALEGELKEKKNKAYDLEDELKKSKEEADTLREMWTEGEAKIAGLRTQIEKEFRKSASCFDPFHLLDKDSRRVSVGIAEFIVLAALLKTNPPHDFMDRQITIILPKYSDLMDRLASAREMCEDMVRDMVKAMKKKGEAP
jgi:chromosome segregation ATPase